MYQVHPLIAHLPVGLFLGAGVMALLGLFYKRGLFKEILVWIIGLGILTTIPNIFTGMKDAQMLLHETDMQDILSLHKRNSFIMMFLFLAIFLWYIFRRKIMHYSEYVISVAIIFFSCSTVLYASFTGYELVFKYGAHVQGCEVDHISSQKLPNQDDNKTLLTIPHSVPGSLYYDTVPKKNIAED